MMPELPGTHPDLPSLIQASSVIHWGERAGVSVGSLDVDQVLGLMTPQAVLEQVEHHRAIISPTEYPTFDSLLRERQRIRNLELVPLRSDMTQAAYEKMTPEIFLPIIRDHYLQDSVASLVRELYPSDLPADTDQYVVWVNSRETSDHMIAEFIARNMKVLNRSLSEVILFERSRTTKTPFVRAAVPEFRHVHVWIRK